MAKLLKCAGTVISIGTYFGCPAPSPIEETLDLGELLLVDQVSARQLTDEHGFPTGRTELVLSFAEPVVILANDFAPTIVIPVEDPVNGLETRELSVISVQQEADATLLELVVAGPISHGVTISVSDGELAVASTEKVAKEEVVASSVQLSNDTLMSAREASLWYKPYRVSDPSFFPVSIVEGGRGAEDVAILEVPEDDAGVRDELAFSLEMLEVAGFISTPEQLARLSVYDNPAARQSSTIEGSFHARALAAVVLSPERTRDVLLGGANEFGVPAIVRLANLGAGDGMVRFENGVMNVALSNRLTRESLLGYVPTVVHEAHHAIALVGKNEEFVANMDETSHWMDLVLANPEYALGATQFDGIEHVSRIVAFNNSELFLMLCSGRRNFPYPGLERAPVVREGIRDIEEELGDIFSYRDVLELTTENTADMDTPGHEYLDTFLYELTGGESGDPTVMNYNYDDESVAWADTVLKYSADEVFQVLQVLRLRLAESI